MILMLLIILLCTLQTDEKHLTCRSQFIIILQYIKGYKPVERFLSFEDIHNQTANGLCEVLKKVYNLSMLKKTHSSSIRWRRGNEW